jgi:hypothetical protein
LTSHGKGDDSAFRDGRPDSAVIAPGVATIFGWVIE